MMQDSATFNQVNKAFKNFMLRDVSFSIRKGYITGFIGPNGAGKSTIIKLLLNVLKPDSGEINVFDQAYDDSSKAIKQRIGFVFSDHHLYQHLTIDKMRKIISNFYVKWDDDLFEVYLKQFKLSLNDRVGHLSKGMGMKLSIAIALSHHAELIVLDEPTAALDPISRRDILQLLQEVIQDEEKAVFFSTHITTDLEQIADYILFLWDGSIVLDEEKDAILERHVIVRGPKELLDKDIRALFLQIKETSVGFEALTTQAGLVRRLMSDEVVMEQATLEDIMVYTVGDLQ
ncbi:ABC transporter ATP-binding protein [Alkalihalobacillus sp. LMS6]|uniref:ABC transporter ATP-binding protein n=1 Tax=Alkalihalobacillus sp. LMS6 TaxID=2924034 RepID=UPI0020D00534|nr:ABC transporter ATP-binding protein [Alkalihalobacillus sp. LMS6]UTR07072.1 ABC transporter ATP-binding protein [Alkalihalobacillus sp. LMS6]